MKIYLAEYNNWTGYGKWYKEPNPAITLEIDSGACLPVTFVCAHSEVSDPVFSEDRKSLNAVCRECLKTLEAPLPVWITL
jgi:hypothetical protein